MEKETKPNNKTKKFVSFLSYFSDHNFLIVVLTVMFYLVVSTYFISYFNRLSLPFSTLNLPLTFYLTAGNNLLKIILFLIAFIAIILIYYRLIFSFKNNSNQPQFAIRRIAIYMPFLMILAIVYILYIPSLPASFEWKIPENSNIYMTMDSGLFNLSFFEMFIVMLLIGVLEIFIFLIFKRLSLKEIVTSQRSETISILVGILLIISIVNTFPSMVGYYSAEDLLRGYSDHFEINLSLKEKNNSINNNTFILVMKCDGNYYLIENSGSTQELAPPKLLIVPDSQIQTATVQKVYSNSIFYSR